MVQEKDDLIAGRERQLQELNRQLQVNEAVVADFQRALVQREKEIEQLHELEVTQTLEKGTEQLASATPVETITLKWRASPHVQGHQLE